MKGLDIGPRDVPVKDFDTLDIDPEWAPSYQACWGAEPLPIFDQIYDVVYASHVLQFIPWEDTVVALEEAYRILKPGGTIEIWVPDFDQIQAGMRGEYIPDELAFTKGVGPQNNWEWFLSKVFGSDPHWHKSIFGRAELQLYLGRAGFKHVTKKEVPLGFDHGKISLGVTAVKLLGDQDV